MRLVDDLSALATTSGFRKLLAVRLVSQLGDGMLQAGLASLFIFSPETATSVAGVAAALVVMALPYSLVGPFTGPFLDRWRRRQVLVWGNLLRFALVLLILPLMFASMMWAVYPLVLLALGVSRFMLAGLSAGLPMVVARERLLIANSLVPTLGGVATAFGACVGIVLRLALPNPELRNVGSLVVATLLFLASSAVARLFGCDELGPERVESRGRLGSQITSAASDIAAAARYLVRRGTPAAALGAMAAHRFVYGMQLIMLILAGRNLFADSANADAGLASAGALFGAMVAGHGVAVLLTPMARAYVRPSTWIVVCLVAGTVGQICIVLWPSRLWYLLGLVIFGVGVQGAKIAVDTIVQSDTVDEYRGRAFSIYDVLFNIAECVAAGVAVIVVPITGWSRPVHIVLVAVVWIVATVYSLIISRLNGEPRIV